VGAAQAAAIVGKLSTTDHLVIDVLATVHIASGQQLRRVLNAANPVGDRRIRHRLQRLTDLRLLARLDRRVGGLHAGSDGYIYRLDVIGQRLAQPEVRRRRPSTPGVAFTQHALAVTECLVVSRELAATGQLELLQFHGEPQCWRSFAGRGGAAMILKPDASVVTAGADYQDAWFLEIDRSTEHPARLLSKANAYIDYWQSGVEQAQHGVFPKVLWVVPDEARQAVVVNVLADLSPEHWQLFAVCVQANFATTITSGAGGGS